MSVYIRLFQVKNVCLFRSGNIALDLVMSGQNWLDRVMTC